MSDEQESKLYLEEITEFCHTEYQNKKCGECPDCSYDEHCPKSCEKCLRYIHYPKNAPSPRQYDCPKLANFYVCRYTHKYTSEIIYALQLMKSVREKKSINVLSLGCGPCTELFALDYLNKKEIYKYDNLSYFGIDMLQNVWGHVHNRVKDKSQNSNSINYIYLDAISGINEYLKYGISPNIIIINYLLSNMVINSSEEYVKSFANKISETFNNLMKPGDYILLNDTNLSKYHGGARCLFDSILSKCNNAISKKLHFNINYKEFHYDYGTEHENNSLVVSLEEYLSFYSPINNCSSAQLIIKKVKQ